MLHWKQRGNKNVLSFFLLNNKIIVTFKEHDIESMQQFFFLFIYCYCVSVYIKVFVIAVSLLRVCLFILSNTTKQYNRKYSTGSSRQKEYEGYNFLQKKTHTYPCTLVHFNIRVQTDWKVQQLKGKSNRIKWKTSPQKSGRK